MRRRSDRSIPCTTESLYDRWRAAVVASVRGDTDALEHACRRVVDVLSSGPDQLDAELARFGRDLGAEGWLLTDLGSWIADLVVMAGDAGSSLQRFDAGVALAHGWADGYLFCVQAFECTDSLTGLVTVPVLRHRLGQVYDQCAGLGVPAAHVYCLGVIDAAFGDRPPLERDAAMIIVGDHVTHAYHGGETAAVKGGRIVILASRTESTHEQFLGLLASLHHHPLLTGGRIVGWIEELPPTADDLEGYLVALCA